MSNSKTDSYSIVINPKVHKFCVMNDKNRSLHSSWKSLVDARQALRDLNSFAVVTITENEETKEIKYE